MNFETSVIHLAEKPYIDNIWGDVVKSIHLTSTYQLQDLEPMGHFYQRYDNQTREALEKKLAYSEKANYCLVFSSGMAAITSVIFSIITLNCRIVAFDDLYSVTRKIFNQVLPKYNIIVDYIDFTSDFEISKDVSLVWLESPTNPMMKMIDVKKVVKKIKESNPRTVVVFDNTFLSPYFYNPLDDGVDIVVHSATKYINGHSDCMAGAVMLNNQQLFEKIKEYRNNFGNALSPFDSYLVLRGLKTLHLRMQKHQENCIKVIEYLKTKSFVSKILHPSLCEKDNISANVRGFGGTVSFLVDFTPSQIRHFISNLKVINHAVSLGGVESLICVPHFSTHKGIEGIPYNLIRLSVGIENVNDIIDDLEQAFVKVNSVKV
ncbi:MAG: PLP-dependent aspartate aminotransferase family protein [Candidatus Calescibacterium sp.]|nr:PLP-dependent aspartate aminotransferase family protein [Candidatus Calescibacterium sp.]MDW8132886.1 PLP-dependent aspartate aminotransferase family protein [Candidatus Calescibacterium sp.]